MLSLMLNLCLAGQPCKEIRVADFYSAQAAYLCSLNRDGMAEQSKKEGRTGTFECKSGLGPSNLKSLAVLNFKVCTADSTCETFPLADFYGKESAAPICAKNADYMRSGFETAAKETGAIIKLDCHS
jgi:hypothetical protein